MSNYTLCGPCASLTTCPICKTLYKVDDLMIQCVECERFVKIRSSLYQNIAYCFVKENLKFREHFHVTEHFKEVANRDLIRTIINPKLLVFMS
jgi:hypothetical protein